MCGFAGILNSSTPISRALAARIASRVAFRGPDHTGIAVYDDHLKKTDAGIHVFFFNRLSIIDLDPRSHQPFEDERFTLLFNGEIYNYQDLKTVLKNRGVTFNTTSDTEVLFHSLKLWGKDAIPLLNGMFAFAWVDRRDRTFLLARDRVGIKPLYYQRENDSLLFGSELNSIVRFTGRLPAVYKPAVQAYLWLQYVPSPWSIADGIFKLPAGNYLEGSFDPLRSSPAVFPQPYWDAYDQVRIDPVSPPGPLEPLLLDSLKSQLHADVPIGLFLSSGVDSSLLAALVNKHFARETPFTFLTIGFHEKTDTDESDDAAQFLREFRNPNLRHYKLTIDPDSIGETLDSLYDFYDEPFGDPASLLNLVISRKAREWVKVVLSGDGADELFWGYPRYNDWKKFQNGPWRRFPFRIVLSLLARMFSGSKFQNRLLRRIVRDPVELHDLLLKPWGFAFPEDVCRSKNLWWTAGLEKIENRRDLTEIIDLKTYLVDAMFYKVDRSSMAASLEVRVPYLDNRVIDYALALPVEEKSSALFSTKAPLKQLLALLAPHYPAHRPKKGFGLPLHHWLTTSWKDRILSTVTKETLTDLGLDPRPYLDIVRQYFFRGSDLSCEVWRLFNLALWYQNYKRIKA